MSSEDGDPYEAFGGDEEDSAGEDAAIGDAPEVAVADVTADDSSALYAYAPGDMLSTPATAQLVSTSPQPTSAVSTTPQGSATPGRQRSSQPTDGAAGSRSAGPSGQVQGSPSGAAAGSAQGGSYGSGPSDAGTPRLLQAIVWQHEKVLSLFPWQLRAHFFLSLSATRLYLLMGLWPRSAAVVAAAPRRLRQTAAPHAQFRPPPPPHEAAGAGPGGAASPLRDAAATDPVSAHLRHPHAQV
jgi:hypothetical protein